MGYGKSGDEKEAKKCLTWAKYLHASGMKKGHRGNDGDSNNGNSNNDEEKSSTMSYEAEDDSVTSMKITARTIKPHLLRSSDMRPNLPLNGAFV